MDKKKSESLCIRIGNWTSTVLLIFLLLVIVNLILGSILGYKVANRDFTGKTFPILNNDLDNPFVTVTVTSAGGVCTPIIPFHCYTAYINGKITVPSELTPAIIAGGNLVVTNHEQLIIIGNLQVKQAEWDKIDVTPTSIEVSP